MTVAVNPYPKRDIKSWYIVQEKRDNQNDWWDMEARIPVDGTIDSATTAWENMKQAINLFPGSAWRIIIRTEHQIAIHERGEQS